MSSILVGMFDNEAAAAEARTRLTAAGFAPTAVELAGGKTASESTRTQGAVAETAHEGGPIARFFDSIFGSDDDADADRGRYTDTYQEAFNRGSYGVSVTAGDAQLEQAEQILNDCGAIDIDERAETWRKDGWTGGTAARADLTSGTVQAGDTAKLQEISEKLAVGKRTVARGGVRIFSRVTEVPVSETVQLREEHAQVRRTPVDRPATEADFAAFKEGSIEVRETAEEAVVAKTARVTGEVEIGKTVTEREETVHDTVRQTQVDVEPIAGGSVPSATGMSQPGTGHAGVVTGSASTGVGGGLTDTGGPAASASAGDWASAPSTGSLNPDPLTGEPGSHPVGTGVGAAAGGVAAGAAVGSVAGPIGTAVGAAAGAIAGGLAGKGVAEEIDPTTGKARS